MSLDSIMQKIDKKIAELDEIAELDKQLDDWEGKAFESAKKIINAENKISLQKEAEIKSALKKIAREYTLDIQENDTELSLFYKENSIVKFVFDEKKSTFTRFENSKPLYTLQFLYKNKIQNAAQNLTASGFSETEMKQSKIERCKKQIELDEEYIKSLAAENFFVQVLLSDSTKNPNQRLQTKDFDTVGDFLEFVLE